MNLRTLNQDPPVPIDLCPEGHGIWFDQGELGALLGGMPSAEGDPTTRDITSFLGEVFSSEAGHPPTPAATDKS